MPKLPRPHFFAGNPEVPGGVAEAEGGLRAQRSRSGCLAPRLYGGSSGDGGTTLAVWYLSSVDSPGPPEHARGCAGGDRYGSGVAVGPLALWPGSGCLRSHRHGSLSDMHRASCCGLLLCPPPPPPPHPDCGPAPGTCPWPPTATCGSWAGAATGRWRSWGTGGTAGRSADFGPVMGVRGTQGFAEAPPTKVRSRDGLKGYSSLMALPQGKCPRSPRLGHAVP